MTVLIIGIILSLVLYFAIKEYRKLQAREEPIENLKETLGEVKRDIDAEHVVSTINKQKDKLNKMREKNSAATVDINESEESK